MIRAALALLPAALLLAACGKGDKDPAAEAVAKAATVPCALGGAKAFDERCAVERSSSNDGLTLILHHPDGGFRRLQVATDGRGVVTADGADQAMVKVVDPGTIDVTVGDDRYRLPATVKGEALPQR